MTSKLVAESVAPTSSVDDVAVDVLTHTHTLHQVADLAGYVKWILVSGVGRNCYGCQTRLKET